MKKIASYLAFLLLLMACKKEIPFTGTLQKEFIVVNGFIQDDSIVKVSLSHSTPAIGIVDTLANQITTGATLLLTDISTNEKFTSDSVDIDGNFIFKTKGIKGHNYQLALNHPDYGVVTSSITSIPSPVSISEWDTSSIANTKGKGVKNKLLNFTFTDPIGKNYYVFKIVAIDTFEMVEKNVTIRVQDNTQISGKTNGDFLFLDDALFENQTKSVSLNFRPSYYGSGSFGPSQFSLGTGMERKYRFEFYNVTEEVYNYLLSVSNSVQSRKNPLSEPVKVFTNITNGYGIFGGYAKTVVLLK
jgi:Domain of unknown function (DUF4249)